MDNFKVRFVRKAQSYGVPVGQQVKGTSAKSSIGLERPGHKYIKRENLGNGKYKYIYDEAKGSKAPSDKDMLAMVDEMKAGVAQSKEFKRYSRYFEQKDYSNAATAIDARGEDVTPEAFVQELTNLKGALGTKVSEYLPAGIAVKEYKTMLNMAGNRTTEYNKKLTESLQNSQEGKNANG